MLLGGVCLPGIVPPCAAEDPPAEYSSGVLIRFEGPITPMLQGYLFRKLDEAEHRGEDLVIIEIDSPGGYLDASLAIAKRLRDIEWARTVAYVPNQALSGAAIVALGCDEIIMDPDAKLGDAGPIFQGDDFQFHYAPEKIRSDLAQDVRDLAAKKGRPPALAEAMVDMDLVVYSVENTETGEQTYMADHEIESDENPSRWKKGPPVGESREGKFLDVNGVRAVELHMARGNVSSREELKRRYGPEYFRTVEPSGWDTAITILNMPLVTGLLFVIGLIALYVEFSAPGIGLGGLTTVLCFGLFFWSRFLGGTAGWLEVILFVSGLMFLAVELFVLPGFGIAGLSGLLLLLASLVLASHTFVIPRTPRELTVLTHTLVMIFLSGGTFVAAAVMFSRHFGSIPLFNKLAIQPPDATDPAEGSAGQRLNLQVGNTGIADSLLRPAGKARFADRYVDVVTEGAFITKGSPVKIIEITGNRVVVSEVEKME